MELDISCSLRDALPSHTVSSLVKLWLTEDVSSFDFGGMVVGNETKRAHLFMKSSGLLAGVPFFEAVFNELGCKVTWYINEGDYVDLEYAKKVKIGEVEGPCQQILLGERTALNCLARSSGIATLAKTYQEIVKEKDLHHDPADIGQPLVALSADANLVFKKVTGCHSHILFQRWKGRVAGTRKTTPGFRLVEKYALLVAGIDTHRYNLSTMVMLKDNHVNAAGSIQQAVEKAKSVAGFSIKIEVECSSLADGLEAAKTGADIVMFDNFTSQVILADVIQGTKNSTYPSDITKAAEDFKKDFPHVLVEASGGIDQQNLSEYCNPFVDIISTSKLVQGYPVVDFSLKIPR